MNSHKNTPQQESSGQQTDSVVAEAIAALQEFRQNLHNFFLRRADALMELIDALASNTNARSVVELSLSPLLRREYSSVYDAIEHFFAPSARENVVQEQLAHRAAVPSVASTRVPRRTAISPAGIGSTSTGLVLICVGVA